MFAILLPTKREFDLHHVYPGPLPKFLFANRLAQQSLSAFLVDSLVLLWWQLRKSTARITFEILLYIIHLGCSLRNTLYAIVSYRRFLLLCFLHDIQDRSRLLDISEAINIPFSRRTSHAIGLISGNSSITRSAIEVS